MNVEKIPASIVKAMCKFSMAVEAIKQSGYNKHGGYKHATVDDIFAGSTRKLGEVGLTIMPLELEFEIVKGTNKDGGTTQWLRAIYQFVFATEEDTWTDKTCRRSIFLQVTGPQTSESASSYAQKAFLRSVFKLPTGDHDPDSMPQAETEEDQAALLQPKKRRSSYAAKKDGKSPELFNEITQAIKDALNPEMLQHVRTIYADEFASLPTQWAFQLSEEYDLKMSSFEAFKDAAE